MSQILFANPFRADGIWFKGNLHTHSNNSDGLLTPYQLYYLYRANGYSFLSITDHDKLTDVSEIADKLADDFLLIPGEEIEAGRSELGTHYHLVALNLTVEIKPKPEDDPQQIIDMVRDYGGEVILAHPYWSSLTINDLLRLRDYIGVEVFNSTCHFSIGKGYSLVHWDNLLERGRLTLGFAVDDAHWHFSPTRPVDACYAWIMVKAKELTIESLMDSLRRGLFYSSNGPTIFDVEVNSSFIHVKTSPAKAINFVADRSLGRRFTASTEPITEATYKVRGREKYVRIEVEDWEGKMAWTNPIIFQSNQS